MEILKLLLIDDEHIILKGMAETYDWASMGYEVVGMADSGEAALALIEDEEPDVVITDVRMKKISGLELIERTRLSHPDIKFVVISAYRDFEYARRACQEGALSYLVKPIDDDELEEIMKKAYTLCMESRKKEERYENWRKILIEDNGSFLSQMIERYVKDAIGEGELRALAESLSKDIGFDHYFAAVCIDVDELYKVSSKTETDGKRYVLLNELKKELEENFQAWQYTNHDGSQIFLVNLGGNSNILKLRKMVEQKKEESGYPVISAISNAYVGLGGMKTAYQQALKLYEIACEAGAGLLVVPRDASVTVNTRYFTEIENQVLRSLRKNSREELKEAFEQIVYNLPSNEDTAKAYLHRMAVQVEVMLEDSYEISKNMVAGFGNFYGALERYTLLRLIDALYKLLLAVIQERLTSAPALSEEYFSDYMKDALLYIQEHLQEEELSITLVAEKVFLNPVYFGRFFKNVMGMTFKRYVLDQRMERAKKLILESGQSIALIGEKVGIPNPSYFSQLFKQATGMLPSEYKKEYNL